LIYTLPFSPFDYSGGSNPIAGTASATVPSQFLLILRASTGAFVNLVDFGPAPAGQAGDVKVDRSSCDFVVMIFTDTTQRGICSWNTGPYKVMMNINQTGSIVDTPQQCYPSQTASFTPSVTKRATDSVSPSISTTERATSSVSITSESNSPTGKSIRTTEASPSAASSFDFVRYSEGSLSELSSKQLQKAYSMVKPQTFEFTKRASQSEVVLRILSSDITDKHDNPLTVGVLTIPAKTFNEGCALSIYQANNTDPPPSSDPCTKSSTEQLTASIEVETNGRCGDVSAIRNKLLLQLAGELNVIQSTSQ